MQKYYFPFVLLCILAAVGCGRNVPAEGRVIFSHDGSPLTAGMVLFDDGKMNARGVIDKDGTFVMSSLKKNDGLPPGTYRVSIVAAYELLPCPENEDDDPSNDIYPPPQIRLIDEKYENVETSGIVVDVEKSTKSYEITVDKPGLDVPVKKKTP